MKDATPIKQIFRAEWETNYRDREVNPEDFSNFFVEKKNQGAETYRSGDSLFIEENPKAKPSGPFHIVSSNVDDKYIEDFKRFLIFLGGNKKIDVATIFLGSANLLGRAPSFIKNNIQITENTDPNHIEPFVLNANIKLFMKDFLQVVKEQM